MAVAPPAFPSPVAAVVPFAETRLFTTVGRHRRKQLQARKLREAIIDEQARSQMWCSSRA